VGELLSALLSRMNFSVALMAGKIRGVQVDTNRLVSRVAPDNAPNSAPDALQALAMLEASLLAGDVSKQTHEAIVNEIDSQDAGPANPKAAARKPSLPASSPGTIAGLILGSPEFQRR
jgi:hypothetical protein